MKKLILVVGDVSVGARERVRTRVQQTGSSVLVFPLTEDEWQLVNLTVGERIPFSSLPADSDTYKLAPNSKLAVPVSELLGEDNPAEKTIAWMAEYFKSIGYIVAVMAAKKVYDEPVTQRWLQHLKPKETLDAAGNPRG
ncbi:MAG TPA: hypothetical protein VD907_04715 [Verrucomicrobiae bacterium]|nr:hypothetical protein [Verrucomicrobiae bacterium]